MAGKPTVEFSVAECRVTFPESRCGVSHRQDFANASPLSLSGKFGGDSWTASEVVMGRQPCVDCHYQW